MKGNGDEPPLAGRTLDETVKRCFDGGRACLPGAKATIVGAKTYYGGGEGTRPVKA